MNDIQRVTSRSQLAFLVMETDRGFLAAIEEAKAGAAECGVPIGACLVSKSGKILGRGHNMRIQKGSATLHVCFPSRQSEGSRPDSSIHIGGDILSRK